MEYIVTYPKLGSFGRLGNQLFQIAATVAYAQRTGRKATFTRWYCKRDQVAYADYFEHSLDYREPPAQMTPFTEHVPYEAPIPDLAGHVSLRGYFQSESYFANCPGRIRHFFTPKSSLEASLRSKWAGALHGITCSIHIRRGDYLNLSHLYPTCTVEYYRRAMDYMMTQGTHQFLVFGDDLDWAREALHGAPAPTRFISGQSGIEDLFLMSFCDNHIIANSSFSWWGSWLNRNPAKCVVAPSEWGPNPDVRDIYGPDWVVM